MLNFPGSGVPGGLGIPVGGRQTPTLSKLCKKTPKLFCQLDCVKCAACAGWNTGRLFSDNGECDQPDCQSGNCVPPACAKDPNDIAGPAGRGPARWLPVDTELNYRIRFENRAEATADANRVFIEHHIDPSIDLTTFRLTGVGFQNLEYAVPENQAVFQQRIDLEATLGIFVEVTAGLDVANRRVVWLFQAIDPATGEPPEAIDMGVLPPNPINGTDGQGYVTFKVQAAPLTPPGTRVRAEARIIFDEELPITTPEWFNTIDEPPVTSVVLINVDAELRARRSVPEPTSDQVILSIDTNGADVDRVDLYARDIFLADTQWVLVGTATTGSPYVTFVTSPGVTYEFASVGQSSSGVREQIVGNDLGNSDLTTILATESLCISNCTQRGQCYLGQCLCEPGYGGTACDESVIASDPPFLQVFPLAEVLAGEPAALEVNAALVAAGPAGLTLIVVVESSHEILLFKDEVSLAQSAAGRWELDVSSLTNLTVSSEQSTTLTVSAHAMDGSVVTASSSRSVAMSVSGTTYAPATDPPTDPPTTAPSVTTITNIGTTPQSETSTTTMYAVPSSAPTSLSQSGAGASGSDSDGVGGGTVATIAIAVIIMLSVIAYLCWRKQQSQLKSRTQPALNTALYSDAMEMEEGTTVTKWRSQTRIPGAMAAAGTPSPLQATNSTGARAPDDGAVTETSFSNDPDVQARGPEEGQRETHRRASFAEEAGMLGTPVSPQKLDPALRLRSTSYDSALDELIDEILDAPGPVVTDEAEPPATMEPNAFVRGPGNSVRMQSLRRFKLSRQDGDTTDELLGEADIEGSSTIDAEAEAASPPRASAVVEPAYLSAGNTGATSGQPDDGGGTEASAVAAPATPSQSSFSDP